MAHQFTLTFEGMCAFADRGTQIEAYLPTGHGIHGANLIIRSDFLFIPNTTWKPTTIGMVYEGGVPRQIAIWDLHGEELQIKASKTAAGLPAWNKTDLIDFSVEHAGAATLPAREIIQNDKRMGLVTLTGTTSSLACTPPDPMKDNFELWKNSVSHKVASFSRLVQWQPALGEVPVLVNTRGQVIELLYKTHAWGCVANVAPVSGPEGLKHFHHYYEGITGFSMADYKMTITNKFVDVYDCVPPVGWP